MLAILTVLDNCGSMDLGIAPTEEISDCKAYAHLRNLSRMSMPRRLAQNTLQQLWSCCFRRRQAASASTDRTLVSRRHASFRPKEEVGKLGCLHCRLRYYRRGSGVINNSP